MSHYLMILITLLFFHEQALSSNETDSIIPRHVLFENPSKIAVSLSPNGEYIGYFVTENEVANICIADRKDITHAKMITNEKVRGVSGYSWAYDNKHIMYTKDNNGDGNFNLYAYNIVTQKTTLLTPKSNGKVDLLITNPNKPNTVLISMNARDENYFDLYEISLIDYSQKLVFLNNEFASFIIDNNLDLRFAANFNDDGTKEYFQFKNSQWLSFMLLNKQDVSGTSIIGFDKTNTVMYLRDSRNRDIGAIKALNLDTGNITTIATGKLADITVETRHPIERNIQLVSETYDKPTYKVLDESIAEDVKYLQTLDRGYFVIQDRTTDDKTWLVFSFSDTAPPHYYIYDRVKGKAEFLLSAYSDVEQYKLLPMKSILIKTGDNLKMVSYLTVPFSKDPNKPVPMVLVVHKGSHCRDMPHLNLTHQWLANRGYAALSVNFRGSSGLGKKFLTAGNGEWGRKMQEDLIDSVNWAIKNKIADPNKICIMGTNYGGYATLVGLSFTPDVFACGVDIMGISNLETFMENDVTNKSNGNGIAPGGIKDLRERSPITFAHNIKKPLLIAQGANDLIAKSADSNRTVHAMKNNNIPVIYTLYNKEGHRLIRRENRLSFSAIAEGFLASVLKGKLEPITKNDFKNADFSLNDKEHPTPEIAKQIIDGKPPKLLKNL